MDLQRFTPTSTEQNEIIELQRFTPTSTEQKESMRPPALRRSYAIIPGQSREEHATMATRLDIMNDECRRRLFEKNDDVFADEKKDEPTAQK